MGERSAYRVKKIFIFFIYNKTKIFKHMKDLVIKGKWIKRELLVLIIMFLIALIMNVVGIIKHEGRWMEMLSQLHVVLLLTLVLYLVFGFLRLIIYLLVILFRKIIK